MNKIVFITIFIVLLLLLFIWYVNDKNNMIKSSDGNYYSVIPHKDEKLAAEKLAMINRNIQTLIVYLKNKYKDYSTNKDIITMITNYKSTVLYEHRPSNIEKNVAFTLNKGEAIYICLRDNNGNLHDDNTLMFVALHELTHVSTDLKNHPQGFWELFKWILQNASEAGIIKSINYKEFPQEYCNENKINYNPLFDENLI